MFVNETDDARVRIYLGFQPSTPVSHRGGAEIKEDVALLRSRVFERLLEIIGPDDFPSFDCHGVPPVQYPQWIDRRDERKGIVRTVSAYPNSAVTPHDAFRSRSTQRLSRFGNSLPTAQLRSHLENVRLCEVLEVGPLSVSSSQQGHRGVDHRAALPPMSLRIRDQRPHGRQIVPERHDVLSIPHVAMSRYERVIGFVVRERAQRVNPRCWASYAARRDRPRTRSLHRESGPLSRCRCVRETLGPESRELRGTGPRLHQIPPTVP